MTASRCALIIAIALAFTISPAWAGEYDWPMWRRDPQNTGYSPVPGNMNRTPEILWSYFVGGSAGQAVSLDLDGDGQDEVVFVSAGKIVAVGRDGRELWKTPPMGMSSILGTEDFGGDGGVEILACNSAQSTAYLISLNGSIAWNYSFPSPASGLGRYGIKIEDIHSDYPGPERVEWWATAVNHYAAFIRSSSGREPTWLTAPDPASSARDRKPDAGEEKRKKSEPFQTRAERRRQKKKKKRRR